MWLGWEVRLLARAACMSVGMTPLAFLGPRDSPAAAPDRGSQTLPPAQVAALSCDKIDDHNTWLKDVVAHCANKVRRLNPRGR